MQPQLSESEAVRRAAELAARPGRTLLGLAGAPAAGKSTLAQQLAAHVPGAVVVPMDGFHLPRNLLAARGWTTEQGAPHTFDVAGFVALLRRLRAGDAVRAPDFDRAAGEPVPDAITVPADAPLAIVEGNYLLLDESPWDAAPALLDAVWFVEAAQSLRVDRLVARHVSFGLPVDAARARATTGVDGVNAWLVAASRARADAVVRVG